MPASNLGPGAPMSPQQTTLPKARPHKVSKTKQRPWGTSEQKTNKNPWEKAAPLVHGPLKQRVSKHSIWHLAGRGSNAGPLVGLRMHAQG